MEPICGEWISLDHHPSAATAGAALSSGSVLHPQQDLTEQPRTHSDSSVSRATACSHPRGSHSCLKYFPVGLLPSIPNDPKKPS